MDSQQRGLYDFVLVLLSVVLLAAAGCLFLGATFYSWLMSVSSPRWVYSQNYGVYVDCMNRILFPLLVATIFALGLCLPKRLWNRQELTLANTVVLCVALVATIVFGAKSGLISFVALCLVFQGFVVILTAIKCKYLRFELEGYWVKLGSAILHFSFVLMVADFVIWEGPEYHLRIFWISTVMLLLGSAMSFYGSEVAALVRRRVHAGEDASPQA